MFFAGYIYFEGAYNCEEWDGGGYGDGTHFSADDDGGGGLNAWRGKTYGNGYGDIATDKRKQYAKIPDITYHSGGGTGDGEPLAFV